MDVIRATESKFAAVVGCWSINFLNRKAPKMLPDNAGADAQRSIVVLHLFWMLVVGGNRGSVSSAAMWT